MYLHANITFVSLALNIYLPYNPQTLLQFFKNHILKTFFKKQLQNVPKNVHVSLL